MREGGLLISSDIMRGYNDIIILGILQSGDSYGYELSKEIQRRSSGQYQMKEATLYAALNRLEKAGYVSSYSGRETQGRPRTYFCISEAGKAFLQSKILEWAQTQTVIEAFIGGTNDAEN